VVISGSAKRNTARRLLKSCRLGSPKIARLIDSPRPKPFREQDMLDAAARALDDDRDHRAQL
jgi:predicted RNase H-like nuclease